MIETPLLWSHFLSLYSEPCMAFKNCFSDRRDPSRLDWKLSHIFFRGKENGQCSGSRQFYESLLFLRGPATAGKCWMEVLSFDVFLWKTVRIRKIWKIDPSPRVNNWTRVFLLVVYLNTNPTSIFLEPLGGRIHKPWYCICKNLFCTSLLKRKIASCYVDKRTWSFLIGGKSHTALPLPVEDWSIFHWRTLKLLLNAGLFKRGSTQIL